MKQKEDRNAEDQNEYSFVSRDELAFVRCCESIGCALKSTSGALTLKTVCTALPFAAALLCYAVFLFRFQVQCFQETLDLIVLSTAPFTPERQCMSIAVRDPKSADHVLVLCKGSEERVKLCLSTENAAQETTVQGLKHAETFAKEGGRVICFAYKVPLLYPLTSIQRWQLIMWLG